MTLSAHALLLEPSSPANYGIKLCLEQHGPLTDTIDGIGDIMDRLGNPDSLGVNLDTGNSWLGGTNPVDLAKKYHDKIYHIHWKDLGPEWLPKRGTIFGCGFSTIEVGTGCIDVAGVIEVLKDNTNIKYSTLEVGGSAELLRASAKYIEDRWNA